MYDPRTFDPLGDEPLIDAEMLDFNLTNNFSMMFVGKHGVGKTASVRAAVANKGWRMAYFSGGTIDPWVNFVGLPREMFDETKKVRYSDLILPRIFAVEDIDVVFLDEYNRAPKPVRNATMELVQFGTVNGQPLPNLKAVFSAMNPDSDESYIDVEPIDSAQIDRFDIHYSVPYSPCPVFMRHAYGEGIAENALEWWTNLPAEMKEAVSPRRLCKTLDYYICGGDIRLILPRESLPDLLSKELGSTPYMTQLVELHDASDQVIRETMADEGTYAHLIRYITRSELACQKFLPHLTDEQRMTIVNDGRVLLMMVQMSEFHPHIRSNIADVLRGGDRDMARRAALAIERDGLGSLFPELAEVQFDN